MSDSRDQIFAELNKAVRPFTEIDSPSEYLPVVPIEDASPSELTARFIHEAEKLACVIHLVDDDVSAIQVLLELMGNQKRISTWNMDEIPLIGLAEALYEAGFEIIAPDDPDVEVGLTGAQAALATTGSLVLESGAGKYRAPSILPLRHIAVLKQSQIYPSLEAWLAHQRQMGLDDFRRASNILLVSGPSRTADIAMELVMGMHGPRELHIILVAK